MQMFRKNSFDGLYGLPRGEAYLGFGQPDRNKQHEVPIILDINRTKNAEYVGEDGIFNNIEYSAFTTFIFV